MRRSDPKRMSYFPAYIDCLQIILEIDSTLDLLHLLSYVLMIPTSGRMVIPLYFTAPLGGRPSTLVRQRAAQKLED
jgi:hypothetical protein